MRTPALVCLLLALTVAACAKGADGRDAAVSGDSARPDAVVADAGRDADSCPATCPPGETCREGRCQLVGCGPDTPCPTGQSCCAGSCVSLPNDPFNCGACGRTCDSRGTSCQSGQCRCADGPQCSEPEICCAEGCIDVSRDAANCGACGRACADGEVCEDGDCIMPPCDPACAPGETCEATTMTCMCGTGPACAEGQSCCGGTCIDTTGDTSNCGRCGNVCGAGEACLAGTCTTDVPCDPPCATGETCVGGVCRCGAGPSCSGVTQCCSGSCVDVNSSVAHCGACGRTCGGAEQCCSGLCINTSNNVDNCGGCGVDCGDAADSCVGGACSCRGGPACLLPPCLPPPFPACAL